ncbi:MAG: calcium/sodium antiporter [Bacteroidaceae bacterium]|nr:calcium/sodium antiporter [Bacteroidaceae bacterium]
MLIVDVICILVGLVMILVGSDWLVDGASSVARKYGISEFVIGVTIVGIGTSMPELVSSAISAIGGHGDMALGNVTGSNICNVLLILGVTALISPIGYTRSNIRKDIPLALAVSMFLLLVLYNGFGLFGGVPGISRMDALFLLLFFVIFMVDSFKSGKQDAVEEVTEEGKSMPIGKAVVLIVLGLAGLVFGGRLFVDHTVSIAEQFHVSEAFISITLMALGTSLPELATCVVAAMKGKNQLALGNVIGSNIFNILLIIGASGLISPFEIQSISAVDMIMVVAAMVMLWMAALTFKKRELDRVEGAIFLLCYIGYITYLSLNI